MRRRLTHLLVAALLATACRSPEEKLVDRRRDLREALDRLYAEYAEGAGAPPAAEDGPAEGAEPGVVGRFVRELDRSRFEESCLAVGRGERPFLLSGRLEAFLADRGNSRACREAARVDSDVAALEREVQARP